MSVKPYEQIKLGWRIFPDAYEAEGFLGHFTKYDSKQRRAKLHAVAGQNTVVTDGKISVRNGSERFGADSSTQTPIMTEETFSKRDGTKLRFRSYGTVVEWRHPTLMTAWATLDTGFTTGRRFGTAIHNVNGDAVSYLYFCNAREAVFRWSGSYGFVASTTATTIVLQGSTTLANLGFTATGSVVINGTDYAYTGISGQTFTGVTPDPTGEAAGSAVTQVPIAVSNAPRGDILMTWQTRLLIAGVERDSSGAVYERQTSLFASSITDATTWTISSPRTAGQAYIVDTPQGGGPIIGLAQDEKGVYLIKESEVIFHTTVESQQSSMDDYPIQQPLKALTAQTRSRSIGGVFKKALCAGRNGIYFMNQNNELLLLSRIANLDSPQVSVISDPVQPTFNQAVFDEAVCAAFRSKIYIVAKSTSTVSANDTVFVYNEVTGQWDTPIVGWQVNDFTILNDELHWGSSAVPVSWLMIDARTDDGGPITANWRSWAENFGIPNLEKTADMYYVEGYIARNGVLTVTALLDDDGFTAQHVYSIRGDATRYAWETSPYNPFGAHPFGQEQFGSNVAVSDLKPFYAYLPAKSNASFFNLSFDFAVDGQGQNFEITRFGARIRDVLPEKATLMVSA